MKRICFARSNSMVSDSRVQKEIQALADAGYSVLGVGWDREKSESAVYYFNYANKNIPIYEIPIYSEFGKGFKKNLLPLIKFQFSLFFTLVKHKNEIDIVHACDFDTSLTSYVFCKLYRKKLVYDIFDYYVDAFSVPKSLVKLIKKIDDSIINKSDAVIICTDERREQIYGTVPKKLYVVQNSPEQESFVGLEQSAKNSRVRIGYFGILNHGRLIKELVDIVSENENLELYIGGFGLLEEYIKSNQSDRVVFWGKIPYSDVLRLESCCDILTALYDPKIPNHKYAAPNKFYESIMLGKPVIMCVNTGMSDVVKSYDIGYVIDRFDKGSLLEGIFSLIAKKDQWNGMAIKQRDLYKKYYSWDASKKQLLQLYEAI